MLKKLEYIFNDGAALENLSQAAFPAITICARLIALLQESDITPVQMEKSQSIRRKHILVVAMKTERHCLLVCRPRTKHDQIYVAGKLTSNKMQWIWMAPLRERFQLAHRLSHMCTIDGYLLWWSDTRTLLITFCQTARATFIGFGFHWHRNKNIASQTSWSGSTPSLFPTDSQKNSLN